MRLFLLILIGFAFGSSPLTAQIHNPVKWTYETKDLGADKFELIFKAKIENGWSIYSQYLESDDGPVKTSFEYDPGKHFSLVGKNEEGGGRKESYDKIFEMNLIKFKKDANFKQIVKISDYSKPITGYLEFMTCDDTKCLPPKQIDFEFKLESQEKAAAPKTGAVESTLEKQAAEIAKIDELKIEGVVEAVEETKKAEKLAQGSGNNSGHGKGKINTRDPAKSVDGKGQIFDPVSWTGEVVDNGDGNYALNFKADIDEGWHIYSMFIDEGGPIPTSLNFDEAASLSLAGKPTENSPNVIKVYDKGFEMDLVEFKKEATLTQNINTSDAQQPITGFLEYMVCDAIGCLPPKIVPFKMVPATKAVLLGDEAEEIADSGTGIMAANIVNGEIDQAIAPIQATYKEPIGDCGEEDVATGNSLWWTFFLGFLGGLVALLTPCVWPMIPLTVSFFTKGSKDRASGIKNGLAYGISIIVIYVGLGSLINAIFGPTALNALSTNWIANVLFFVMFIAFAISFFGYYEITLPSSWANKSDAMAEKGGYIGTFFMAATLSLVSFSCTGPIIGSALVTAASNPIGPIVVMLGFSAALALPFGLFAAFPAWLNTLPKSGSWMTSVKVVLGFVELALALKFLSVADMTMHWGILKYEVFLALWVIIAFATAAYLFGYIRFAHDTKLTKLSPARGAFGLLFLAFGIYLITGFQTNDKTGQYNSLSLMSGLAPPAIYNLLKPEPEVDPLLKSEYSTYTKCANNLDCFKDYYEGVSYAKKNNLPVLLDFTGYGCVNCRKTEEHIWIDDRVWEKLDQDFVLISLYVDDREKLEQILVSANTKERLRNVGSKWADFQIVNFQQNSQPLYVMMTPEEQVLAAPRGYKEGIKGYIEFLECGLETFKGMERDGQLGSLN